MSQFIDQLEIEFLRHADAYIAFQQKTYLRDKFECFGIKTPKRREIQKPFLVKEYLPPKSQMESLVKEALSKPQREFHHFGQELTQKYCKKCEPNDILFYQWMVLTNSWWDTVDFIAVKLIASYFDQYKEQSEMYVNQWLASNNIWLQRSALLFQLNHKEKMDTQLLAYTIESLLGSNQFFINKAIGWVLRNYGKTNPDWVIDFAEKTPLAPLSNYEALRLIK